MTGGSGSAWSVSLREGSAGPETPVAFSRQDTAQKVPSCHHFLIEKVMCTSARPWLCLAIMASVWRKGDGVGV